MLQHRLPMMPAQMSQFHDSTVVSAGDSIKNMVVVTGCPKARTCILAMYADFIERNRYQDIVAWVQCEKDLEKAAHMGSSYIVCDF